jgi:hypothetical protein
MNVTGPVMGSAVAAFVIGLLAAAALMSLLASAYDLVARWASASAWFALIKGRFPQLLTLNWLVPIGAVVGILVGIEWR